MNQSNHCGETIRGYLQLMRQMLFVALLAVLPCALYGQQELYYPGAWSTWETKSPADAGFDPVRFAAAIEFAKQSENQDSKQLAAVITKSFSREPFFSLIGPVKDRGAANGMILRGGYIVGQWGDTHRVDMTFSVTKSYLSTAAAIAFDRGLIRDVDDPVGDYVRDGTFDGQHNSKITWRHLLNQTSDWSGELWGKPDWADRPVGDDSTKWKDRELKAPGSSFKYNDVRVNLLAYCLTNVFREPLPVVLRKNIMDPIGASPTWRWHGYENSWITIDGQKIQSVSGGGHWGGGMFICSRDHARFGLLFMRNGKWRDRQIVKTDWIEASRHPAEAKQDYGYMWWLNTDQARVPAAPASSFSAAGFGGNYIYVDPQNDLVIVLRWTPNLSGVVEKVLQAINTN